MAGAVWYGDESYDVQPGGKCAVFVAVARPRSDPDHVRAALRGLVLRPRGCLHFYEEGRRRRLALAEALGGLGIDAVVASWSGTGAVGRARSLCLTALVRHLHAEMTQLALESRGTKPDLRDARLLARLHPPACRIPARFLDKGDDPLLWLPDIVAGAALQAQVRGIPDYLRALGAIRWIDA